MADNLDNVTPAVFPDVVQLQESVNRNFSTFNDPIHGTIRLNPVLQKIINTPEFQRLRHIKQLGVTCYVYPEAQHSRFGHSMGTAHLAGKLARHLKENQPKLKISNQDVLCVEIAGLCHDLGHGPFSHLFDGNFLPRLGITHWKHEEGSCKMFDRIMKRLENDEDIKKLKDEDRFFIKEMINVPKPSEELKGGRDNKAFLYEIISNKVCGVDVDKWDYFARDCYHLGIANGFDHNRFIAFTRVIKVEGDGGKQHICVREKEAFNLYQMFHTRYSLHRRAYQHYKKNAVDHMICDALVAADPHVTIPGADERTGCKMSECIQNIDSLCNLDDRVLQKIQHQSSHDPEMQKAKRILRQIREGDHYRPVGKKVLGNSDCDLTEKDVTDQLVEREPSLKDKIIVSLITINYGKGDVDPVSKMWFYKKNDPNKAIRIDKDQVSKLLPEAFQEKILQVFCTENDLMDAAEKAFNELYSSSPSTC